MSFEREILAMSTEDLTARNSPGLLAMQLQNLCAQKIRLLEQSEQEKKAIQSTLSTAEQIGLAVLRAQASGRKTVRIDEVLP